MIQNRNKTKEKNHEICKTAFNYSVRFFFW